MLSRIAVILSIMAMLVFAKMRCPVTAPSDDVYDFSSITSSSPIRAVVANGEGEGYTIYFTACGVSTTDSRCTSDKSAVCVLNDRGQWKYSAAKFDSQEDIMRIAPSDEGVRLIFENKQDSFGGAMRVILTVDCAETPGPASATMTTSVNPAVFNIKAAHPAGCANKSNDSGGGSGGLSGGWIFIISLLSAIVVYVTAGCLINWRLRGLPCGAEACPNGSFWGALPGLVKDGCVLTGQKLRECCKPSASHETVSGDGA